MVNKGGKLKYNLIIISLFITILSLITIHFLTYKHNWCGKKGCVYSAGFPFSYIRDTGAGFSAFKPVFLMINFLIISTVFYFLLIHIFNSKNSK